jgi:hypothetical protein
MGKMVTASFGFLSPPGCARAFSILTTAEWYVKMVFPHGPKFDPLEQQPLTTFYRPDFRNAFAPFTLDMIPVVVTRFPKLLIQLLQVKRLSRRLPQHEDKVQEAVSIAAFLALADIFDQTIPCVGEQQETPPIPFSRLRVSNF